MIVVDTVLVIVGTFALYAVVFVVLIGPIYGWEQEVGMVVTLTSLIVFVMIIGLLLYLVRFIPLQPPLPLILQALIVLLAIVWLINWIPMGPIRVS
jgi:hypothetical protein